MSAIIPLRARHSFKPRKEFHNACASCATVQTQTQCALACCRMFLVALSQEDIDAGLKPLAPFVDLLDKQPNGSCAALDDATQLCTNWEERPLECRTYDCREDSRRVTSKLTVQTRAFVRWPLPDVDTQCTECKTDLQLLGGCRSDCDDHALCANCFAPYRFAFDYQRAIFDLEPALHVPSLDKERHHLTALLYLERFEAAGALLAGRQRERPLTAFERRTLAVVKTEARAFDDALEGLTNLERDHGDSTQIDRAVVLIRAERFDAAAGLLDEAIAVLPLGASALAHYYSGRAARLANKSRRAAQAFVHGLLAAQAAGASLTVFKEQLFEMAAKKNATAIHAEAALDQAELMVPTLRT